MDQLRLGPFIVPKIIAVNHQLVNFSTSSCVVHIICQVIQDLDLKLFQFKAFLNLD